MQSYRGARQSFAFSTALRDALVERSQQAGCTLFMTLLAVFQGLLQRYTGQDDFVVGTPMTHRPHRELEGLIGCFVNTLVLRADLSAQPSFREWLQPVRETALGAYAHQELPFEKLVEDMQPERDPSRNPIFQVLFQLQNTPRAVKDFPELRVSHLGAAGETVQFDVVFTVVEHDDRLHLRVAYNTDLFDAATIQRMLQHWQRLLEGVVAEPDLPMTQLPLLADAERQQVLVQWQGPRADYPQQQCLHALFEAQVARTPNAVAVVSADGQLTYAALNRHANQLARYLHTLGVTPEARIGLCMERCPELLVGLLGILKAGGTYVPLDPTYPQARLAFMLDAAQVAVVVTQAHLQGDLPPPARAVVCLDTDWEVIAQENAENLVNAVTAANLAYVMYTSGSTGQPKGVMIPHRSLVHYITAASVEYGLEARPKFLPLFGDNLLK